MTGVSVRAAASTLGSLPISSSSLRSNAAAAGQDAGAEHGACAEGRDAQIERHLERRRLAEAAEADQRRQPPDQNGHGGGGDRRDGTTYVVFEPLDFIARLAALVPRPRLHLTRYHGIFAPHSALRAQVTPAGRGLGAAPPPQQDSEPPVSRHVALTWAQRLKRVFAIEIERCQGCGGRLKVIASIEAPELVERILAHLKAGGAAPDSPEPSAGLCARAPPQRRLI